MRALVSGGAGFIGSHLVDALVARGDSVLVVDDLSGGRRSNLADALKQDATLSEGSINDLDFLNSQVADFRPEKVFHLAAQVDVRKAVADPAFDATVNVLGSINLLEAVRSLPDVSVVFASTGGAIYGEGATRSLPFAEDAEVAPMAAYGASKYAGELYLDLYRRLYELPGVALRFGNVYGPRQDPQGEAGVVAIFCGLMNAGTPLNVYGDGEQTRDYIFVGDVVAAMLAADDQLVKHGAGVCGPYNVGTGVETSVLELAARLEKAAGVSTSLNNRPGRTGEVQRVVIDPSAAARDLGWRSTTGLEEGLRLTYASIAAR